MSNTHATSTPTIRPFASRDLDAVLELSIAAWRPVFDSFATILGTPLFDYLHPPDWRSYQRASVRRTCESDEIDAFIVVAEDGTIAGYVALAYDLEQRMGVVEQIAIDPRHQRHGYARTLMNFATGQFHDKHLLFASVGTGGDPGHAPARALYEATGFTPLPLVAYYKTLDGHQYPDTSADHEQRPAEPDRAAVPAAVAHPAGTPSMSARQAAAILTDLHESGIRCWVMGGWGIDALLTRTTREHHDLDLLLLADDLPALDAWLRENQFSWVYDWEESQTVELGGRRFSTAFVAAHPDGRELDIHAVRVLDDGSVELATSDPWELPADTLTGRGTIDGTAVACASRDAQQAMHVGYQLPEHHVADLRNLHRT